MIKNTERTFAIALACLTLSSCTYQIAVQDGFYKAPAPAGESQTHMKVGIYVPENVKNQPFHLTEQNNHDIKDEAMVSAFPAFKIALSSALMPFFDVRYMEDLKQTKDLDLVLSIGSSFPNPVTLIFSEPETQFELRRFLHDGPGGGFREPMSQSAWGAMFWNPAWWVMSPIGYQVGQSAVRSAVESSLSEALKALSAQISSDDKLLHYTVTEAQAQSLIDKAVAAQKIGEFDQAFRDFRQALAATWPGGAREEACRRGLIGLAAQLPQPLVLPEEARRHTERGKILVKQAHGAVDFKTAVAEMEQAVDAAPWWADGYYNLGLVQSAASSFGDAAKNLKLYLASKPSASDANATQKKIYELELKSERKIGQ